MRNPRQILVSAALIAWGMFAASETTAQTRIAPPVAPVRVVTDEYFGRKVSDPYRYMENLKDPEVAKWFKEQDHYTRLILSRISGPRGFTREDPGTRRIWPSTGIRRAALSEWKVLLSKEASG